MPLSLNFWLALAAVLLIYWRLFLHRRRKLPWTFTGRVLHVCDGDSLFVKPPLSRRIKVRLAGMDAPETEQPFGRASTECLRKLVEGRRVTVTALAFDPYGRYVAMIETDRGDPVLEMLRRGMCWPYYRYFGTLPPEKRPLYRDAAKEAKTARQGLWRDRRPEPPWLWRERHRTLWSRFLFWLRRLLQKFGIRLIA